MSPVTHLLASWLIATRVTDNPRDARLVSLAGLIPDFDGMGLIVDIATASGTGKGTHYYGQYHHFLWHGLFAAVVTAIVLVLFAKQRGRVLVWAFLIFHLHLLCDFIGSRGPDPDDLWPIFYFGPFRKDPMWLWKGQWPLDGALNRTIFVMLFAAVFFEIFKRRRSVVEVFSQRADNAVVNVIHGWKDRLLKANRLRG